MFTQQDAQQMQPKVEDASQWLAKLKALIDAGAAGQTVSEFQVAMTAAKTAQSVLDLVVRAEFAAGT